MPAKRKRRRKVRWDRVAILAVILLIPIALLYGAIKWITYNPYAKYDVYNEETKLAGSRKHESDEKEDAYYQSVYYPSFEEDALNKAIEEYRSKEIPKEVKGSSMIYVMVDYDSDTVLDRFTTVTFHQVIKDKDDKVIQKKDTSINYDAKSKKILGVKDVLRRDYLTLLQKKAKENKIDEKLITTAGLSNFTISKTGLTFYVDQDNTKSITLTYKDQSSYLALQDKNIPSLYQEEALSAKEQPKVDPKKPMVAITFDDGPHGAYTQEIMSEFEKYNGRATFFMLGQNVEANADIVKDVYQRGFEIGNHSWDHATEIAVTGEFNKEQISDEIYNTQDAIYKITGHDAAYFRPPFGEVNDRLLEANQMGYAFWDVDSKDWESKNVESIRTSVVKSTLAGNKVVLLHDIHEFSKDGLKLILADLNDKGYQFVTYSRLMQYEKEYLLQLDENFGVPKDIANGR